MSPPLSPLSPLLRGGDELPHSTMLYCFPLCCPLLSSIGSSEHRTLVQSRLTTCSGLIVFFLTLGILVDATKGGRTKKSWSWDCSPMVEHVLSVCEGLGSMSNTKAITRVGKVKVVQMILSLLSSRTPGSGYEQRHMGSS